MKFTTINLQQISIFGTLSAEFFCSFKKETLEEVGSLNDNIIKKEIGDIYDLFNDSKALLKTYDILRDKKFSQLFIDFRSYEDKEILRKKENILSSNIFIMRRTIVLVKSCDFKKMLEDVGKELTRKQKELKKSINNFEKYVNKDKI